MKQIQLYNTTLFALVDDADYAWLLNFQWNLKIKLTNHYAYTSINGKRIFMHQLICPSTSEELTPDHKNRNGLDNQRDNLRLATNTQQRANSRLPIPIQKKTSKYRGVCWVKGRSAWRAELQFKNKHIHLGYHKTEISAAKAYNMAAINYFGEFASLNEFDEPLKTTEI